MSDTKQQALADITRMVMQLLDSWKLETAQMQALLCMPKEVRARSFHKFREGQMTFPDDPAVLRRASYLLRISDALRTTYPRNPEMSGRWIRQGHRRFGKRTPLTIMLDGGEGGLIAVLSELDCTFSWDLTGSTAVPGRH
jgi:hypothetical protein